LPREVGQEGLAFHSRQQHGALSPPVSERLSQDVPALAQHGPQGPDIVLSELCELVIDPARLRELQPQGPVPEGTSCGQQAREIAAFPASL
jgi:hypothetical protein